MPDEPVRLSDLIGEIAGLYSNLKETPDPKQAQRFVELAGKLETMAGKLETIAGGLKQQGKSLGDKDSRALALANIDKLVVISEGVQLSSFFASVSKALVDAQTSLNEKSRSYIEGLEKPENAGIPPTYFAIPRMQAEMKVGFSRTTGSGVNVVIFNSKEQKQNFAESTITFEIVSAPPSPDKDRGKGLAQAGEKEESATGGIEDLFNADIFPVRHRTASGTKTVFITGTRLDLTGEEQEEIESVFVSDSAPPALRHFFEEMDSRLSDLERKEEKLREKTRWLDARERLIDANKELLGNRGLLIGDKQVVLRKIREELKASGHRLGKMYDKGEDAALVLSYKAGETKGHLVLWPARAKNDSPETWREMSIFHLSGEPEDLKIDASIFETEPKEGFLRVTNLKDLLALDKKEIANLAINQGDVLMLIVSAFLQWLSPKDDLS